MHRTSKTFSHPSKWFSSLNDKNLFCFFKYEISILKKRKDFYLYFTALFALVMLSLLGPSGAFDPSFQTEVLVNSPYEMFRLGFFFNKIILILIPSTIGYSIYKDYRYSTYKLIYSYPLDSTRFLIVRFFSSFLLLLSISSAIGLAFIISYYSPKLNDVAFGAISPIAIIKFYVLFIIPNIFIYGLFVFGVVAYTRNIYNSYFVILFVFLLQNILQNSLYDNSTLFALLDPFGDGAFMYSTSDWVLGQRNTQAIPVTQIILLNRLVLLTIFAIPSFLLLNKFRLQEFLKTHFIQKHKFTWNPKNNRPKNVIGQSKVSFNYSLRSKLYQIKFLSLHYASIILRSRSFLIIVGGSLIATYFLVERIINSTTPPTNLSTDIVLEVPSFFISIIVMVLTFLYSGLLIRRDTVKNVDSLVNVSAISNVTILISKIVSVLLFQLVALILFMVFCLCLEVFQGAKNIDIMVYIKFIFGTQFLTLLIWCLFSFFVHSFIKKLQLALVVLISLWLMPFILLQLGVQNKLLLLNFNKPLKLAYFDNFYDLLLPFYLYKLYWVFISITLLVFIYQLPNRYVNVSRAQTVAFLRKRLNRKVVFALLGLLSLVLIFGHLGNKIG